MTPKHEHGGRREGAGRKPVDPEAGARTERVMARFAPDEYAMVASVAAELDLTVAEFVRDAAVRAARRRS